MGWGAVSLKSDKKRQEATTSDTKRQEDFYKHYNAILCMLNSKIDHILHVQVFVFK